MENLLKTEQDHKEFKKWIRALKSGKYKQTNYVLQDYDGYCCLGVACEVVIDKKDLKKDYYSGSIVGAFPEDQKSPNWLKKINSHIYKEFGWSLSVLNDSRNYSFKEIAQVLEFFYKNDML